MYPKVGAKITICCLVTLEINKAKLKKAKTL